jgi:hypothetical protein
MYTTKSKWILEETEMPDLCPMLGRSKGIHVSTVVNYIAKERGYLPRMDKIFPVVWGQLGKAFENSIARSYRIHYPGRFVDLGELELDGIYGTPDLYDLEQDCIDEIKLAWLGSKRTPADKKFWRYIAQLKSYCRMADTRIGRLKVCHLFSDYAGSPPCYRQYLFRFSKFDLASNWALIKSTGEMMVEEGLIEVD